MRSRLLTALLMVLAVVAACGGDDDGAAGGESCEIDDLDLVTAGTLTIATGEPAFPPWVVDDDPTNKEGFEAAVAYAVAAEMGFSDDQVTWVRTGFNEAIAPGPKTFDFNLQQYSIDDQRDEVVDFSDPYYTVRQALVAYSDASIASANSVADLQSYRLGAQLGTTSFDFIEEVIEPSTPAAAYDDNVAAKAALDAQQIDGLVFDLPTAYYITGVEIPESTIVGQFESPGGAPEELGLLFAEGSSLVPCVNQALATLRDDGTLAALETQWLAQEGDIKTIAQ